MTIEFHGDVQEFSMNTAYFTVTPQEFYCAFETEKEVNYWAQWLQETIKDQLLKMGGGIIWWRVKPETENAQVGDLPDMRIDPKLQEHYPAALARKRFCWKGYARFATSPPLPENIIFLLTESRDATAKKIKALRDKAIAEFAP